MVQSAVATADQDEVGGLAANLESEAGAGHLNKNWSAPTIGSPAACNALAVFAAKDKSALLKAGYDNDALCRSGDVQRNALVRRVHEFVQNGVRRVDAVDEFLRRLGLHGGRG